MRSHIYIIEIYRSSVSIILRVNVYLYIYKEPVINCNNVRIILSDRHNRGGGGKHFGVQKIMRLGSTLTYKTHSAWISLHCIAHRYVNTHSPTIKTIWSRIEQWKTCRQVVNAFPVAYTTHYRRLIDDWKYRVTRTTIAEFIPRSRWQALCVDIEVTAVHWPKYYLRYLRTVVLISVCRSGRQSVATQSLLSTVSLAMVLPPKCQTHVGA